MIILLIGPSGVGKSSCGKHAAEQIENCEFYDLDDCIQTDNNGFLKTPQISWAEFSRRSGQSLSKIEAMSSDAILTIVAVGAGSLQQPETALKWLEKYKSVCIMAPAEEVHPRRSRGRLLEQYQAMEYSPDRMAIYDKCSHRFCVEGFRKRDAQEKFVEFILREFNAYCSCLRRRSDSEA